MVRGTLEVLLVGAKGLRNMDFFRKMDPYAILICCTQEQRSSVASGAGCNPEWNDSFVFTLSDNVCALIIKIMDSDMITKDDFVGEAKIPLEPLFMKGRLLPTAYNVVKDQKYCGEIKVGLSFTPKENKMLLGPGAYRFPHEPYPMAIVIATRVEGQILPSMVNGNDLTEKVICSLWKFKKIG